ncbi:glycosyltransferase [Mesorhizobium sp. AR02]|uniref:glycosyltransferase n=1 Tax=Mesorhizobium sp. AR02 TaxID=2865837 RepID=UPI002160422E|nr:glycosyltransferase [Mesorhizobium sp. AR02]UVK53896.1 glycosyltransferase [Mesorhizobium sp. AR02]
MQKLFPRSANDVSLGPKEMRIAIDLQCCQSGSRLGGIGRYSLDLAKAMISASREHELIVLLNNRLPQAIQSIRNEFRNILPQTNIMVFDVPAGASFRRGRKESISTAEIIREEFIRQVNPDVLHIASVIEGFDEEVVSSIGIANSSMPVAATLYDLIPLVNQDHYLNDTAIREHYLQRIDCLSRANLLMAISKYSADEARRLLLDFSGEIVNIQGGIDEKFFRTLPNPDLLAEIRKKHGIDGEYLLYTASFDMRKNQEGLIQAFARLPLEIRERYQVVLVGNGWPGIYQHLRNVAGQSRLSDNAIVFTGRVEDAELVELYRSCRLFVFASFWEGLGLPIIEAMACGAPVVSSYTTSLPEFLPHASAGFDPESIDSMSSKIAEFLQDEVRLSWLRDVGVDHAKQFTWQRTAKTAIAALAKLHKSMVTERPARKIADESAVFSALRQVAVREADVSEAASSYVRNEIELGADWLRRAPIKAGWISTWGTRCGIASYSQNLVSRMKDKPTIFTTYADRGTFPGIDVVPCWRQGKQDDLFELRAQLAPLDLDQLVIQFNYGFFDFLALSDLIDEQVSAGVSVSIVLHSTMDPVDEMPNNRLGVLGAALARVDAIFVHSVADMKRLEDLGLERNVELLPQGAPIRENDLAVKKRTRKRIASYGFFLPGKGLSELISATAEILKHGTEIELLMVNANYGDETGVSSGLIEECKQQIRSLGIEGHVTIIDDFLEDAESIRYLQTADLIVFPYQRTGESSSAAVRMGMTAMRPVAVTPIPIFDDVRPAVFSLPGLTASAIARGIVDILGELKSGSERAKNVMQAANRWRTTHDVTLVAEYLERRLRSLSLGVGGA